MKYPNPGLGRFLDIIISNSVIFFREDNYSAIAVFRRIQSALVE